MKEMAFVKIRLLVTVAMLLSSTLMGCHIGVPEPADIRVAAGLDGRRVEAELHHPERDSGGRQHAQTAVGLELQHPVPVEADAKIGDPGVLKQDSHTYVGPSTDVLGAPGSEVWTFIALKPGTTTISTHYSSFVGKNTGPVCQYSAIVTVQ